MNSNVEPLDIRMLVQASGDDRQIPVRKSSGNEEFKKVLHCGVKRSATTFRKKDTRSFNKTLNFETLMEFEPLADVPVTTAFEETQTSFVDDQPERHQTQPLDMRLELDLFPTSSDSLGGSDSGGAGGRVANMDHTLQQQQQGHKMIGVKHVKSGNTMKSVELAQLMKRSGNSQPLVKKKSLPKSGNNNNGDNNGVSQNNKEEKKDDCNSAGDVRREHYDEWLRKKEQKRQLMRQIERQKQIALEEQKNQSEQQLMDMRRESFARWLRGKDEERAREKERMRLQQERERQLEIDKRERLEQEAQRRLQRWEQRKLEEHKRQKAQRQAEAARLAEDKAVKQRLGEVAFQKWLDDTQARPRPLAPPPVPRPRGHQHHGQLSGGISTWDSMSLSEIEVQPVSIAEMLTGSLG